MSMKKSEDLDKIAPALVRAVAAIGVVTKDRQADRYRYADIASVLEEIKPILAEHGLVVIQPPVVSYVQLTIDAETAGDLAKADMPLQMISTMILHESGQFICGEFIIPDIDKLGSRMTGAQALGSAVTYLRRYSLFAALSIATEDDDGAGASNRPPEADGYRDRDDRRPVQSRSGGGYDEGRAPAGARSNDPAPRSGPPKTGKALFAWVNEQDEKLGVELLRTITDWGKAEKYPPRMIAWNDEQVRAGYAEVVRLLKALKA